jgi:hypothetical protein
MGELIERTKLSGLVNSDGAPDFFKENSLYFYEKYLKSDDEVQSVSIKQIFKGGFYFLHYKDDSNWMKWSPVFVADFKKYGNQIVLFCVNFNFMPLEVRVAIFDKYITEKDFEKNNFLPVSFQAMYQELKRLKFEYAIVEYNAIQIVKAHRINLEALPRFLYSQHPKVKYDPTKLLHIWKTKVEKSGARDAEMTQATIDDFYNVNKDISEKFTHLENHIKRLRTSMEKYGRG